MYDQPPQAPMPGGTPPPPWGPRAAVSRPGNVLASAIMAYIGGGFAVTLGLVVTLASMNEAFLSGFLRSAQDSGLDVDEQTVFFVALFLGLFLLLEGVAVIVLGIFSMLGRNGARWGLSVLGGLHVVLGIVDLAMGSPQVVVAIVYCGVGVALLWLGKANDWYAYRKQVRNGTAGGPGTPPGLGPIYYPEPPA